jgi:DUF4097 and DUF4098 domain-containing protein YvlB
MKRYAICAVALLCATFLPAAGQGEGGEFSFDGIQALEIDAKSFEVEIQGTSGRRATMTIENMPDRHTVRHSISGSRVRIWVELETTLFSRPHRGRLVFHVPRETELTVGTSTGAVRISGISANSLRVDTSTGNIELEDIRSELRARSNTGTIDVRRSVGRFDIGSVTGSITLRGIDGDITASSSTGRHIYDDVRGDIDARSTTGRIELNDTIGRVWLHTSTGSQSGRAVTLTGNSSFRASTGSVDIDLTNSLEELEFDLTSSTGSLQVGRERSQRRLFLGGTGIAVTGSTSTGSQRFF